MSEGLIKIKATIERKLFYSDDSMFGIYAASSDNDELPLNDFGNITIKGNSPELLIDEEYDIILQEVHDEKYGHQYEIVRVEPKKPETKLEQQKFVKAIATEKQYEEIVKVYPDHKLLDLIENDEFDYELVKGFGESTYKKLKNKLFSNIEIQEALVELDYLDISSKSMKTLIAHFGTASTLVQKIKQNIYELCEVKGFGFIKVDGYAQERGDDPENEHRIEYAVKYILEQNENSGHSWLNRQEVVKQAEELLRIDYERIIEVLDKLKESDYKKTGVYFDESKVALYSSYYFENGVYNELLRIKNTEIADKNLDIDERIEKIEVEQGFTYTSEQRLAIKKSLQNNVLVINGFGGTGKTSVVKGVINALDDDYCCCALSGSAAKVLGREGLNSMTIHRMLGYTPKGFKYNDKNKLPYKTVVLDEASMANSYLIFNIARAIPEGGKLILVGDNGQLPSLGAGAIFDDILNDTNNTIPQQELTKVHRQAQKSGILSTANELRKGEQVTGRYNYEQQTVGELRDMTIIPTDKEDNILEIIKSIAKRQDKPEPSEFQVLSGLKERGYLSTKNLNTELQKIFNDVNKPSINRNGYEYRTGDKIIHNGNNYEAGISEMLHIYNGTLGEIVHIDFDRDKTKQNHVVHIKFEQIDEVIKYDMEDIHRIELAYAITVHRSQGSSIENVVLAFDYSAFMLLSREFVYTGITRASKACILIAENAALHRAIDHVAGGSRRTFLGDMLKQGK